MDLIYIVFRNLAPTIIIFSVLGIILLRKGLKIKSNVCQNCGNKIIQEKVCPKCSSIINNKGQAKKVLLFCGGICCVIAGYNLLKLFRVIILALLGI